MTNVEDEFEKFRQDHRTLDLAGLSYEQRSEGSIALGGSMAEYEDPSGSTDFSRIGTVVFRWGDPEAEATFNEIERLRGPALPGMILFSATTIIDTDAWALNLQGHDFDPDRVFRSRRHFTEIPYDQTRGAEVMSELMDIPIPRPMPIGRVGDAHWVTFAWAVSLNSSSSTR